VRVLLQHVEEHRVPMLAQLGRHKNLKRLSVGSMFQPTLSGNV
jgi:hypothetical protein